MLRFAMNNFHRFFILNSKTWTVSTWCEPEKCSNLPFWLCVYYIVLCTYIYFDQIVNNRSSGVNHSEKMRTIRFSIWLFWFLETNAELTLETVYKKVNDLEVEVTALKVFDQGVTGNTASP